MFLYSLSFLKKIYKGYYIIIYTPLPFFNNDEN